MNVPEPGSPTLADPQAVLRQWRREGLWRMDPVRFAWLEALARRLPACAEPVRLRLQARLQAALHDYAGRLQQARQSAAAVGASLAAGRPALSRAVRPLQAAGDLRGLARLAARSTPRTAEALAALNRHAQQASPTLQAASASDIEAGREDLSSVRAFRALWGRRQAVDRLAQARQRQPAKAGPLNSHVLVLQTLELVQQLSPDYLRHCLVQVEALQWLEQAAQTPAPAQTAKPRRVSQRVRKA